MADASGYHYGQNKKLGHHYAYLLDPVMQIISVQDKREIFELGCGNGSFASYLEGKGFKVVEIDPSTDGIKIANKEFPRINLQIGSSYENLSDRFGRFPIVVSLEVVEHLYDPKLYASNVFNMLENGVLFILSTPYHGYVKNITIALLGKFDKHVSPLWDHGHIKFWSINTLSRLLRSAGFVDIEIKLVGRVPWLAKSMILSAKKPNK